MLFRRSERVYAVLQLSKTALLAVFFAVVAGGEVAFDTRADGQSSNAQTVSNSRKRERPPSIPRPDVFAGNPTEIAPFRPDFATIASLDAGPVRKQNLTPIVENCARLMVRLSTQPSEKSALCDRLTNEVLYRAARALAYMELPGALVKEPFDNEIRRHEAFERAYALLASRTDISADEYVLLHLRWLRRHGKNSQAFAVVEKLLAETENDPVRRFWYTKKRRDVLRDLGETTKAEKTQHVLDRDFPSWIAFFDEKP